MGHTVLRLVLPILLLYPTNNGVLQAERLNSTLSCKCGLAHNQLQRFLLALVMASIDQRKEIPSAVSLSVAVPNVIVSLCCRGAASEHQVLLQTRKTTTDTKCLKLCMQMESYRIRCLRMV